MSEEQDGKFIFKLNPTKTCLTITQMGLDKLQVSGAIIYARLFEESEKRPFEFPMGRTKKYELRKSGSGAPKFYFSGKIDCLCVLFIFILNSPLVIKNLLIF